MSRSIKVEGLAELMDSLNSIPSLGKDSVRAVVDEATRAVHAAAVDGIRDGATSSPGQYPRSQTGRLKASVRMELPTDAGRAVGVVGSNAIHGMFLEFGTSSMEPRPWLLPSFERGIQDVAGNLRAEFEGRL